MLYRHLITILSRTAQLRQHVLKHVTKLHLNRDSLFAGAFISYCYHSTVIYSNQKHKHLILCLFMICCQVSFAICMHKTKKHLTSRTDVCESISAAVAFSDYCSRALVASTALLPFAQLKTKFSTQIKLEHQLVAGINCDK